MYVLFITSSFITIHRTLLDEGLSKTCKLIRLCLTQFSYITDIF